MKWYAASIVVGLFLFSSATAALSQQRVWRDTGLNGGITAFDCIECGDDIGMSIACQGDQSNALVKIPFAALPRYRGGTLPLRLTIDGQTFKFDATLQEEGMIGFVPVFELPANDPLMTAMQSGRAMQVTIADLATEIGLAGSREALEIFKAHCGWSRMQQVAAAPATSSSAPTAPTETGDTGRWFLTQFPDRNDTPILQLAYGIPETDAVLFGASCNADKANSEVEVSVLVDVGALNDGEKTQLRISTPSGDFTYPVNVFTAGSESAGVQFRLGARAPLWRAIERADAVDFSIQNGPVASTTAGDSNGVIQSFVDACFQRPPKQITAQTTESDENTGTASETSDTSAVTSDEKQGGDDSIADAAMSPEVADTSTPGSEATPYRCSDGTTAELSLAGDSPKRQATLSIDGANASTFNQLSPKLPNLFSGKGMTLTVTDSGLKILSAKANVDCIKP